MIKDGSWVASDAFIYPGVSIEEMAVVAARSTVLKSIPPNEIHAGSPARFIKFRFNANENGMTADSERAYLQQF
jgi:putative colanic acid biosynthesis acetyltransferase WcaF